MINTYATAITQYVQAGGTSYAYRRMGRESGVPLIFMQNFRQGMDNIDPGCWTGLARTVRSSSSTTLVSRKSDLHETSK